MDLGLSRAERAIVVAKEAARQIGVIMISDCGDQTCFFSHCYVLEFFLQCPSSPMQCGTLKFRILNVLIPTLLTTLTDLVALFVELSYVQTCSECGLVFILD